MFPHLVWEVVRDGPNQVWNGDITYVTVASGFVYVALILDAWSGRVVGYAIGRSIDARLAVAALTAATASRPTAVRMPLSYRPRDHSTPRRAIASCLPSTGWSGR